MKLTLFHWEKYFIGVTKKHSYVKTKTDQRNILKRICLILKNQSANK